MIVSAMNVNYDQPCALLQFTPAIFSAATSRPAAITAPPSCAWTAPAGASWIHVNSASSGQEDGPAMSPCHAAPTARRQSTPIVQTGGVLSILSVSPGFGSGNAGRFTFQLRDETGCGGIGGLLVDSGNALDCTLEAKKLSGIDLLDDTGEWLGPIPMGAGGQTPSSAIRAVSPSGSFAGLRHQLQPALPMSFWAAFGGDRRITREGWSSSGADTGTGTVSALPVPGSGARDGNPGGITNVTSVQLVMKGAPGGLVSALDPTQDGRAGVLDVRPISNAALG